MAPVRPRIVSTGNEKPQEGVRARGAGKGAQGHKPSLPRGPSTRAPRTSVGAEAQPPVSAGTLKGTRSETTHGPQRGQQPWENQRPHLPGYGVSGKPHALRTSVSWPVKWGQHGSLPSLCSVFLSGPAQTEPRGHHPGLSQSAWECSGTPREAHLRSPPPPPRVARDGAARVPGHVEKPGYVGGRTRAPGWVPRGGPVGRTGCPMTGCSVCQRARV